jgi:4-amino-4-deoxy-L-arabinose transferase-like glycosyltransferase
MTVAETPTAQPVRSWRAAGLRAVRFWSSPPGQPGWARPALLAVTVLAAVSYLWGIAGQQPEIFYAAAVRSMASSWHNFFFAAFDPRATISIDKLPGALWIQALAVRLLGLHLWVLNLPQAIEGTLTVLVLYRAVRRLCGPVAAITAAVVSAAMPATVALGRGNVSDSLLILLLVCAVDAASAAVVTGRSRWLLVAGVWVGLAFQAKMVQAWLLLPGVGLAWLVAAPPAAARRWLMAAAMLVVTVVVSLSWMLAVTAVPQASRPYVDGSSHDSLFEQVFVYNGFGRADPSPGGSLSSAALPLPRLQAVTLDSGSRADRLVAGAGGRDIGWLLPVAAVGLVAGAVVSRRRPRGDPLRAACLLWTLWLVADMAAFAVTDTINAYYLAALAPPIGALTGMGVALAWPALRGAPRRARLAVAALGAVTAVYGWWLLAPAPAAVRIAALIAALVLCVIAAAAASRWLLPAVLAAVLIAPAVAAGAIVTEGGGPFNTPFQPAAERAITQSFVAATVDNARSVVSRMTLGQGTRYLAASYTSLLAAPLVYATGAEILPIGGFRGTAPAPTLSQLIADIKTGQVHTVFFFPARDSRLSWVQGHCSSLSAPGAPIRTYFCGTPPSP